MLKLLTELFKNERQEDPPLQKEQEVNNVEKTAPETQGPFVYSEDGETFSYVCGPVTFIKIPMRFLDKFKENLLTVKSYVRNNQVDWVIDLVEGWEQKEKVDAYIKEKIKSLPDSKPFGLDKKVWDKFLSNSCWNISYAVLEFNRDLKYGALYHYIKPRPITESDVDIYFKDKIDKLIKNKQKELKKELRKRTERYLQRPLHYKPSRSL